MRSVLLIILLMGENSLAGVSLIEKETSTEFRRENLQQSTKAPLLNNRVTKIYKLSKTKAKLTPNNWYEVNGVLNQHYVYLVIENTRKNQISGYLFNGNQSEYVYGEWVKDYLQVYDQSNNRLMILVND